MERHSAPEEGRYREVITARRGETIRSSALPALTIPVDVALGYSTR